MKTYLGRPWRDFSNVIYLNTEMSGVVRPEGWQNWNLPVREKTARYSEFRSTGPGANAKARVAWSHQLTKAQANVITIKRVLGGRMGGILYCQPQWLLEGVDCATLRNRCS